MTKTTKPTLSDIFHHLDKLIAFIGLVRDGTPIVWHDTQTGEKHIASNEENLAFIEDQLLIIACDVEELYHIILNITGRMTNETN